MAEIFLTSLVYIILILPFLFFLPKKDITYSKQNIFLVLVFVFLGEIIIHIETIFPFLSIGRFNWIGKISSALFALSVYYFFNKNFGQFRFVRWQQKNKVISRLGLFFGVILILSVLFFLLGTFYLNNFWNRDTVDFEDAVFTLFVPGIEEEIVYRGVLLGLLCASFKEIRLFNSKNFFHPGIWITGFLFGLAHGLKIGSSWQLQIDITEIVSSTVFSGSSP